MPAPARTTGHLDTVRPRFPQIFYCGGGFFLICAQLMALLAFHGAVKAQTYSLGKDNARFSLQLIFEPNLGQLANPALEFQARLPGGSAWFGDGEYFVMSDNPNAVAGPTSAAHVVRIRYMDARQNSLPVGSDVAPGHINHILGDDPKQWRTNIPTYHSLVYRDLWPGIDVLFDGAGGLLKSTYVVAPAATAEAIGWCYEGATRIVVDAVGNLHVVVTPGQEFVESAPIAWQETRSGRQPVTARYQTGIQDACVRIAIGSYDSSMPLVIDPTLTYSTYFGGSLADIANDVALGPDGAIYITGVTYSTNLLTAGDGDAQLDGGADAFVAKLSADGSTLLFSTYLGGSSNENQFAGGALAVDQNGDVYVTGESPSSNFPRVNQLAGVSAVGTNSDIFVAKLSGEGGTLLYSSLIGSSGRDIGMGIAVDEGGNAYVAGKADGSTFPLIAPLYKYNGGDAVVFKVAPGGNQLIFSTYFGTSQSGDSANDIAVDAYGTIYVTGEVFGADLPIVDGLQPQKAGITGRDAFLAKFSGDGRRLLYSSYFGGSDDDTGNRIAVDSQGQAVITGNTKSADLSTTAGADNTLSGPSDAFVAKFNEAASALVFSTYLGGSGDENYGNPNNPGVAVDAEGSIYASGHTGSTNFPAMKQLPGQTLNTSTAVYLTKFAPEGSIIYSTLFGGPETERGLGVAVDAAGTAVIAGSINSKELPVVDPIQTDSGGGPDAFVARIAHGAGETVQFGPANLEYMPQVVNNTSEPQSFLVTSLAATGLPLSRITLEGPHAAEFAVTSHDCPLDSELAFLHTCRVAVTFQPAASGLRTARIVIASPLWNGPRVVPLLGYGQPAVTLNTALIEFLAQKPNTASSLKRIVMTNIGSESIVLGAAELLGLDSTAFSVVSNTCSNVTLAPAAVCFTDVRFQPTALGGYYAEIRFNSPVFNEPPRVALQGTSALPPALAVSHKTRPPGVVFDESPLCTCMGGLVVATGSNFPVGGAVTLQVTSRTGSIYPLGSATTGPNGDFTADLTVPEIAGGGVVTLTATAQGQPPASVLIRMPRTDILPIIVIPGVSASTLVATDNFNYLAPPDPALLELGFNYYTANPLLPENHVVLKGHTPWLDLWAVGRILLGQYRYMDMLKLRTDGLTPEPDLLGNEPKIGVGDVLWDVAGQDFFASLRSVLKGRGYVEGQTLFYFPYDWRKDLTLTSNNLRFVIQQAKAASGKDKVIIIAHSMGGLVTRNYLVTFGTSDVDQVISIGTPYLGSPKAAKILEVGDPWGLELKTFGVGAGMHPNQMKKLAQNFPGAYQLVPPKDWFEIGDPYIIRSRSTPQGRILEPLDFAASTRFIGERHNAPLLKLADRFFNRRIGDLSFLTDQYYAQRIIGIDVPTSGRIEYTDRETCANTPFGVACIPLIELAFPKLNLFGDDTVPLASALGLNPRDRRTYFVTGAHHSGQPAHPKVQELVLLMLDGKLCDADQIKSMEPLVLQPLAAQPESNIISADFASAQMQDTRTEFSGIEIIVYGTGDLSIIDAQGRLTGRDRNGAPYAAKTDIPRSSYELVSGLQIAVVPGMQPYEIRVGGTITGVAQLQISTLVDGVVTERVLYEGIGTLPQTFATLTLDANGLAVPPVLNYSYTGAMPTIPMQPLPKLSGAALDDLTPPAVSVTADSQRVVTVVAQDNPGGTGVQKVYYTTNAEPARVFLYERPFEIPNGASKISAFAVDMAGNSTTQHAEISVEQRNSLWLPMIVR